MIKARAGKLFIFGLEEMNLVKLREGEPMLIDLRELGADGGSVVIMYGKTKDDIVKQLHDVYGFENVGVH